MEEAVNPKDLFRQISPALLAALDVKESEGYGVVYKANLKNDDVECSVTSPGSKKPILQITTNHRVGAVIKPMHEDRVLMALTQISDRNAAIVFTKIMNSEVLSAFPPRPPSPRERRTESAAGAPGASTDVTP